MESKLINYSIFIEKRPDMEIHTEVAIVSCINSAYVLLDGECASLISQVDKFNMVDDRASLDTNHELYRTDFELGQLQEALVFQVQYVLNMGNDFTVGGGSYSIGNINSSYSRPEGRELIAPGVYKLLSNARVYHLNAFGSFSNQNTNEIPLSTSKEIMERVKNEYVAQNQPNAQVGNVAYINQSKQVAFGSPQDLQITTYNTNRIAGPEGYRNNFYEIDSVPNIAFFGPDYNGTYSAVHRQEMIDYVNQNAGENLGQEIAQIKQEQEEQNNKINQNKNLIDSTYEEAIGAVRKNAEQDETIRNQETRIESNWNNINNLNQRVGTNTTNIQTNTTNIQTNTNEISAIKTKDTEMENRIFQHENEIVRLDGWSRALDTTVQAVEQKVQTNTNNITALDGRLLSVSGLLNQTIDGLRTLRPFKFVGLYDSSRTYMINEMVSKDDKFYLSLEDNNTTTPPGDKWLIMKEFQQVDLSDYPTKLEVEGIKNNLQQSITSNTTNITNLQNDTVKLSGAQNISGVKTITATGEALKFNSGSDTSAYISGYKSGNQRIWYFGKGSSHDNHFRIGTDRADIKLEPNGKVDLSNKKISFLADPTADQDATNKRYVDTNITTIRNNYLDKTATGVQQIAAGSVYFNNQVIINQPYNPNLTPNVDFQVSGQGYIENLEVDNATFTTSVSVPTPTQNDHAANKQYVDNAIQNITPGSGGSIDTSNFATLNTNQTISGQKTFTNRIFANGGITNLPKPTNTQEAANKQYVDNKTGLYTMFSSNTIYNNLQKITTRIFDNSAVDYNKPLTVSFTRTNTAGTDYGSYIFQIQYGIGENNFVVGSNLYYDRSKTYGQLGDWVALTITPSYIQVQCWNGGDRIKNIRVQGWKKV